MAVARARTADAAFAVLTVLLLVHLANALGALSLAEVASEALYDAIIMASAALCLTRGLLRTHERRPWLVIGAGMALWSSADLSFSVAYGMQGTPAFPNFTTPSTWRPYACSYGGVVLLLAARYRPTAGRCGSTASSPR